MCGYICSCILCRFVGDVTSKIVFKLPGLAPLLEIWSLAQDAASARAGIVDERYFSTIPKCDE